MKLHFLLCEHHAEDEENKALYEEFKNKILQADWQKKLHSSIFVAVHTSTTGNDNDELPQHSGSPAYILQPFPFSGHMFNLMLWGLISSYQPLI